MNEVRIIGWKICLQNGQCSAKVQLSDGRSGTLVRKKGYFEVMNSLKKNKNDCHRLLYVSYGHPDQELARKIIQERDSFKFRKNHCLKTSNRNELWRIC